MKPGACPLCSCGNVGILFDHARDYITGREFQVWRCRECEVGFTYPQSDQVNFYYPSEYRAYRWPVAAALKSLYRFRVRSWKKSCRQGGAVLEVGCGRGLMLEIFRRSGWSVVGIERSAAMAFFARHKLGLPVFAGGLEAILPQPHFDLIILFHVLEHLPDPLGVLLQCATLLRPGGSVVVGAPNLDSWQARYAGPRWFHLDVPRHRYHFSPRSLQRVIQQAGLTVSNASFVSLEHDPYGWIESALNRSEILGPGRLNVLTRGLMRLDSFTPHSLAALLLGALLAAPSLLVSFGSWLAGRGAIMQIVARRPAAWGRTR